MNIVINSWTEEDRKNSVIEAIAGYSEGPRWYRVLNTMLHGKFVSLQIIAMLTPGLVLKYWPAAAAALFALPLAWKIGLAISAVFAITGLVSGVTYTVGRLRTYFATKQYSAFVKELSRASLDPHPQVQVLLTKEQIAHYNKLVRMLNFAFRYELDFEISDKNTQGFVLVRLQHALHIRKILTSTTKELTSDDLQAAMAATQQYYGFSERVIPGKSRVCTTVDEALKFKKSNLYFAANADVTAALKELVMKFQVVDWLNELTINLNAPMTHEQARQIALLIRSKAQYLKVLHIRGGSSVNHEEVMEIIADAVKVNPHLHTLTCEMSLRKSAALQSIKQSLKRNRALDCNPKPHRKQEMWVLALGGIFIGTIALIFVPVIVHNCFSPLVWAAAPALWSVGTFLIPAALGMIAELIYRGIKQWRNDRAIADYRKACIDDARATPSVPVTVTTAQFLLGHKPQEQKDKHNEMLRYLPRLTRQLLIDRATEKTRLKSSNELPRGITYPNNDKQAFLNTLSTEKPAQTHSLEMTTSRYAFFCAAARAKYRYQSENTVQKNDVSINQAEHNLKASIAADYDEHQLTKLGTITAA